MSKKPTLTLKDVVEYVAACNNMSKAATEQMLKDAFAYIAEGMSVGAKVEIRNFGSFSSAKRAARTARNLHTGELIEVAEKFVPKFSPSSALKTQVANAV